MMLRKMQLVLVAGVLVVLFCYVAIATVVSYDLVDLGGDAFSRFNNDGWGAIKDSHGIGKRIDVSLIWICGSNAR